MKHLKKIFMLCFMMSVAGAIFVSFTGEVEAQDAAKGADLFKVNNCTGCHSLGDVEGAGPGLKGLKDRWADRAELVAFIKNSNDVNTDYATKLKDKYPLVMPPQAALSDAEIDDIIEYLFTQSGVVEKVDIASDEKTIELGRQYFTGEKRFLNGGPSCMSCHTVTGTGTFGGGSLASNVGAEHASLNQAWKRNGGDNGLYAMLQAPGFQIMKTAFEDNPITKEEAAAVTAYLGHVAKENKEEEGGGMVFLFVILALLGTGVVIIGFDRVYVNRFRGVRKQLVGEK